MPWKRLLPLLAVGLALLVACGAPEKRQTPVGVGEVPQWVAHPKADQGIAAAECTVASREYSSDRREVMARAKRQLSRELQARIEAVKTAYDKRFAEGEPSAEDQPFLGASPDLIREALEGMEPRKMGYEKFEERKHFCVVLTLEKSGMRDFFSRLIEQSGVNVGPEEEEALYRAFTSQKTSGSTEGKQTH